ncbi:hypothetical protein BJQ94_18205 [Cryobacterium sp. SO2]|uniref:hypothetical protein n=1 Tax=Cryobacterium sp. SO2 TaxID=1897060 RepID=UPI00223DE33C|nr:hypothetical protein [Cryobacterium sp. SO2]WEO77258.1 hypothetical protein BJQ94_18205 [Cryobacterium sp. SO2]
MQAFTLSIGDRLFRLRTPFDAAEFSARLTAAVRAGGGMVDIPVAGEGHVTVLVSPGVSIVLETHEVETGAVFEQASTVPWIGADDLEF